MYFTVANRSLHGDADGIAGNRLAVAAPLIVPTTAPVAPPIEELWQPYKPMLTANLSRPAHKRVASLQRPQRLPQVLRAEPAPSRAPSRQMVVT